MEIDLQKMSWFREPKEFQIDNDRIIVTSDPFTDLWQKTYYHFVNDNAPLLLTSSNESYFSFQVKTQFKGKRRFDQCGVILWMDSENWAKASAEYQNESCLQLGSVVTQSGYSDWASTDISSEIQEIWYRLSRRESDWRYEVSFDGNRWQQIRVFHMHKTPKQVLFGIYIVSPEDSSFQARFSHLELLPCLWEAHDGQQPD